MRLDHTALTFPSEEAAERFFVGLLGMERRRSFTVPEDLAEEIFGVCREVPVIRYAGEGLDVEAFLSGRDAGPRSPYQHLCLQVEDPDAFLDRARAMGLECRVVARPGGGSAYLFVRDPAGHLYEIQERR